MAVETAPKTIRQHKARRELAVQRWGAMKTERSSYQAHWQDIANVLLPRAGRFFVQDRNVVKQHNDIIDNWATLAAEALPSGLMAGASSPARPWFRLSCSDPELDKYHPVRTWLYEVTEIIRRAFQQSNTYKTLHQVYEELAVFGTAASVILPDFETVIHHYPCTAGEYALACDNKGKVNTLFREFEMTVAQVVDEFGYEACSNHVRNSWNNNNFDAGVAVLHVIEPRRNYDMSKADAKNMPWASCYFEVGGEGDAILRESGFQRFPVLAPRWHLRVRDIYGQSPAMRALGDIRQLQQEQYAKSIGIEKQVDPPVQVPTQLNGFDVETQPGGKTPYDASSPQAGIRSLYDTQLRLDYLLADVQDVRHRIDRAFYVDLFRMLSSSRGDPQKTATEIAELHEEKLIALGPVLDNLHGELLGPMVEHTYWQLLEGGALPPAPPEANGQQIVPQFISMLAQAQRLIGANTTDRFVGALRAVSEFRPEVLDRFDSDYWVDAHADDLGVDPKLLVPIEEAQEIRVARNKAMQAQAQAEMLEKQAGTVKNLAASPTTGENALTDVMNTVSGYNSPSAVEVG